jgi:uncharacterized protein
MVSPATVEHGPWAPHPVRVPVMRHEWQRVTFLHWPYPPDAVQRLLPAGLRVETRQESAWVGLVAFCITVAGPVGPPLPWLQAVPETNVRTYVVGPDGRPGVWFFSLDIVSPDVVAGGRLAWGVPYHWSNMSVESGGGEIIYHCRRYRQHSPTSRVTVQPGAAIAPTNASEFDHYLTARFALWSRKLGVLTYTAVEHPPWALHNGLLRHLDDRLVTATGLSAPSGDPVVHYSPGVQVRIGAFRPVGLDRGGP